MAMTSLQIDWCEENPLRSFVWCTRQTHLFMRKLRAEQRPLAFKDLRNAPRTAFETWKNWTNESVAIALTSARRPVTSGSSRVRSLPARRAAKRTFFSGITVIGYWLETVSLEKSFWHSEGGFSTAPLPASSFVIEASHGCLGRLGLLFWSSTPPQFLWSSFTEALPEPLSARAILTRNFSQVRLRSFSSVRAARTRASRFSRPDIKSKSSGVGPFPAK